MGKIPQMTKAQGPTKAQGMPQSIGTDSQTGTLSGGTDYPSLLKRLDKQDEEIADLRKRVLSLEDNAKSDGAASSPLEGKVKKLLARHGIHENPELDEIEEANAAAGEPTEEQKADESERKSVDAEQELQNIHQRIAARDISRAK